MLRRTTKPLRRVLILEEGLAKSSKKQHSENTDKWHLCKAGSFSYGESGKEPYKNHSEKNRALQNAKKNKTTKKKSSDRRRSSKNL